MMFIIPHYLVHYLVHNIGNRKTVYITLNLPSSYRRLIDKNLPSVSLGRIEFSTKLEEDEEFI
ncbi:MAG: hypothetical protein WB791_00825 [Waddliaceae bacterium]